MPVLIDPKDLSQTALDGLIEQHVLQEGTDYGNQELSLETKSKRLKQLITTKKMLVLYNEDTQSCCICPKEEYITETTDESNPNH